MSSGCRFLLSSAFVLGLSIVAAPAVADDGPDSEDVERAQQLFDEGAELYLEEEFSAAIVRFRRAHENAPHPLFMYNIARAEQSRGRLHDAADAALQARETPGEMDPDSRVANDALIAASGTLEPAEQIVEARVAEIAEADEVEGTEEVDEIDEPADPDGRLGTTGWAGVSALTVGVGALGGALVIDRQIASHQADLEASADEINQEGIDREIDAINSWRTRGQVLLFSGAFLAATGGTLLTLDLIRGSGDESGADVAIGPAGSGPGLGVTARW